MIGLTELLIIAVLFLIFLPALIIGLVVWKVIKRSNRKRVSELESRDRVDEPIVQKDSTLK